MKTFSFLRQHRVWEGNEKIKALMLPMGLFNGYVGIVEDTDIPLDKVSVHGGITLDGHFNDQTDIIPLTEIPADWHKYRIIGFDCLHFGDSEETWPFERTKSEALNLQKQIEDLINNI